MIFYKARKKLERWILKNINYIFSLISSQLVRGGKRKVYIEIDKIALNRYLYNFIKFFILEGYTVYIPGNKKVIDVLNRNKGEFIYASWILKENVKIGKPKKAELIISNKQLSNNYFGNMAGRAYHVPMSEYPGIYRHHYHGEIKQMVKNRKRSIFMSGNIDEDNYQNISEANFFKLPNRSEVAGFIRTKLYYREIETYKELRNFIDSKEDEKVLIIDTSKKFRIPLKELKSILQGFHFYLALPGISIPQSHNLIEAMSVGCIPVIHKVYAELMKPELVHMETAIVYTSLKELDEIIPELFKKEEKILDLLHENIFEYYTSYLTPKAVVSKIMRNDFSKIFIQAENVSLNLQINNFE